MTVRLKTLSIPPRVVCAASAASVVRVNESRTEGNRFGLRCVCRREREKVVRNKMRQQQQQQRASTADTQPDEKSESESEREFLL